MEELELMKKMSHFICHDIVSPLANIKTYLAMLKSEDLSAEEKELILARIEEVSVAGLEMISEMKQTIKKTSFLN